MTSRRQNKKELPSWRIVEDFAEAENIWKQAEQAEQIGIAVIDGMDGVRGVAVALEDQNTVYFPGGRFSDGRCVMWSPGTAFCRRFADRCLGM